MQCGNRMRWLAIASLGLAMAAPVAAQSTDGYHAIQVLPVVVDTASFTQRISLHNHSTLSVTLTPTYYPADGTVEAASSDCSLIVVPGKSEVTVGSLRQLCPHLAAGSAFGMLLLRSGTPRTFAVHSRVSNAAGAGFSVEAFPANDFSGATTVVTGLRRRAASAGAPAFQTNCFVGNLPTFSQATPANTQVTLNVRNAGALVGSTTLSLAPGKLVRMLDVFAAVGDAANEYDQATAEFIPAGRTGVVSFCTVQDNTSFGADFRIGKQVQGTGVFQTMFEVGRIREVAVSGMLHFNGTTPSLVPYQIQPGPNGNTHFLYFRHPDVINCTLMHPTTNQVATPDYGLEMRLLTRINDTAQWEPVAGGDMVTSFANVYLGDKHERGNGGDTIYMLQVESNGLNEGVLRPYKFRCASGSGHTLGELIQVGAPVTF